jgi:hypothetical protein
MKRLGLVFVACVVGAPVAVAQPESDDKGSAKALLQSGLKLFTDKDYLGALAVFTEAYGRFPSPNILLNIGTTLLKLDRKAEAANAYQRFVDTADAASDKLAEVTKVLAELDTELGILEISVSPEDAEVRAGEGTWQRADRLTRTRVATGMVTVHARKAGYRPAAKAINVGAKETRAVAIALVAFSGTTTGDGTSVDDGVTAQGGRSASPRFGAIVLAHVDPVNLGGAGLIGAIVEVADRVQVRAAALLGPAPGAYLGGSFAILTGRVRPFVSAGMPMFFSDGPRFALRGAGGVELALSTRIGLLAELGVEHVFNPEDSVTPTLFIPAVGAIARL